MSDFETDELASAYLDDAVSDEERARVEADPALRTRVEELRRARDAVRGSRVEPAPTAERDAAIARAIAASPTVDLRAERARRRVRIASIAAAVILLVGAGGLLLRSASQSSSTKSSTAAASLPSSSASNAAEAANSLAVVPSNSGAAYADRDALVAALQSTLRYAQSTTAQSSAAAGAAADNAAPRAADSSAPTACSTSPPEAGAHDVYTERVTLAGAPVQVDVFVLADGSRRVVVTSVDTCTLVFTQPL